MKQAKYNMTKVQPSNEAIYAIRQIEKTLKAHGFKKGDDSSIGDKQYKYKNEVTITICYHE